MAVKPFNVCLATVLAAPAPSEGGGFTAVCGASGALGMVAAIVTVSSYVLFFYSIA